jgi:assimilatory nitrate reductase catalytic subunit
VPVAHAFVAMHWGEEFVSGRGADGALLHGVNALTPSAFCPVSRQPELKHAAVQIDRAMLPWRLLAAAWLPADEALGVRDRLRAVMGSFAYASCVPFGREPADTVGVVFRAANPGGADETVLAAIEEELGLLRHGPPLRYIDASQGQRRILCLVSDRLGKAPRLQGFLLAGDSSAEAWLLPLLQERREVSPQGRTLLAPDARLRAPSAARGRQVCNCFDVTEPQITHLLARLDGTAEQRLAAMQRELHCGTGCGACLPSLRIAARACVAALDASESAKRSPSAVPSLA